MDIYGKLLDLYKKELNIPNNDICRKCDTVSKKALLPWNIGEKYFTEEGRIFIAGKSHRGIPGKLIDNSIIDGRECGRKLFFDKKWAYWSYTRSILNNIFGTTEESWKHITFSNIVKCSSSNTKKCAEHCIIQNGVIFKEIELLQPRKILFFTWSMHRELFQDIPFAKKLTIMEHTDINFKQKCGQKELGWWDRSFTSIWNSKVDFLIIGHPERMKKDRYVDLVTEWLKR